MNDARGSATSSSWPATGQAERPPGSLRSGRVSRTGHAPWNSSRNIPHRSRCYWLKKRRSSQSVATTPRSAHSAVPEAPLSSLPGLVTQRPPSPLDPIPRNTPRAATGNQSQTLAGATCCSHANPLRSTQAPKSRENANQTPEGVYLQRTLTS